MKIDSVLEEARADAAVVAPGAARERVWQNLSRPRRSRPTVLLFAGSAALGALLCLGIVRLAQPRTHDEEAVAVLQGAVQRVAFGVPRQDDHLGTVGHEGRDERLAERRSSLHELG